EDEIEQTEEELAKKKSTLSSIEAKIKEISGSNYSLSQKINLINAEITKLKNNIDNTEASLNAKIKEIEEKQLLLEKKKNSIDELSTDLYIQSRNKVSSFFLTRSGWENFVEGLFVRTRTISMLKDEVEKINGEFVTLAESKENLESQKAELETQKSDLDKSYKLLADEKAKLQKELNAQYSTKGAVSASIAELNAQLSSMQKTLIALRTGGTVVNPDSIPSGNDLGSLKYFNSNAPSGYFGVFSFGAYTHRNGMSQWGAKARAEGGQSYIQILNAYYPGKLITTGQVNIGGTVQNIMTNIKTTTYGTLNFEDDYLLRLNEVPDYWAPSKTGNPTLYNKILQVFMAQAISARTYAVNYTANGVNKICTTESCQVVGTTKKTGAWAEAVAATRGMILTDSSKRVFSAQYAAVHGGWGNNVLWDTTDRSGTGDWMAKAWESISGVSWFYKAWYRTGYTSGTTVNSESCYRTPWLSQAEMADIINCYMLWKKIDLKGTPDISKIYPIKDSCHASGAYTHSQVKGFINNPVTSITSVITSSSNGTTNSVTFTTNRGVMVLNGTDFKYMYNLRAPGYLRIQQNGFVHINVQMK
ncbi:MAG: SpoIID/LytB domain-containing protein, partial [Candidatus Dojkabacteria bacterium]|nr:SpoIID/LytB domain-containing protein [Candidatus Dojkabacteria bacterium]